MKNLSSPTLIATILMLPGMSSAGSYGSAGTTDPTVVPPTTTTAFVWCPKLEAEVPQSLQAELDCADGVNVDTVRPRVAPARFTRGLFGLPAHVPSGVSRSSDDDDDNPPVPTTPVSTVSNDPPTPNTPTTQSNDDPPTPNVPTQQTNDDPPPVTTVSNDPVPDNSNPDKWDRLGQLGVNEQNYHQQDQSFLDKVDDFRNQHGSDGDWTNFQP